jgi:hypothetical protein
MSMLSGHCAVRRKLASAALGKVHYLIKKPVGIAGSEQGPMFQRWVDATQHLLAAILVACCRTPWARTTSL